MFDISPILWHILGDSMQTSVFSYQFHPFLVNCHSEDAAVTNEKLQEKKVVWLAVEKAFSFLD